MNEKVKIETTDDAADSGGGGGGEATEAAADSEGDATGDSGSGELASLVGLEPG